MGGVWFSIREFDKLDVSESLNESVGIDLNVVLETHELAWDKAETSVSLSLFCDKLLNPDSFNSVLSVEGLMSSLSHLLCLLPLL